jgi:hypothetical protein
MLASNHFYLVYTPLTIFLWHGSHVDLPRQRGSLHILKTFYNQHLNETFNFMPGYFYEQSTSSSDHCFRVETQGGESRRFKALFEGGTAPLPSGFGTLPTLSKL